MCRVFDEIAYNHDTDTTNSSKKNRLRLSLEEQKMKHKLMLIYHRETNVKNDINRKKSCGDQNDKPYGGDKK